MGCLQNSGLIASAALALLSCSDRTVAPIAAVTLEQEVYKTEFPQEVGCWRDNDNVLCPLIIREDGTLTHQGVAIDPAESSRIETEWERRGFPVLGLAVHPSAQYDVVVKQLSELKESMPSVALPEKNSVPGDRAAVGTMTYLGPADDYVAPAHTLPRFVFVEAKERFSKVGEIRNLYAAAALIERQFVGEVGEHDYGVLVGSTGSYQPCAFKADGLTLTSPELNELAFRRLEQNVMRADNVDRYFEEAGPVARIQADAGTPWQCVGGAAYQLRIAGWPLIKFEVLPNPPKATDAQTSG